MLNRKITLLWLVAIIIFAGCTTTGFTPKEGYKYCGMEISNKETNEKVESCLQEAFLKCEKAQAYFEYNSKNPTTQEMYTLKSVYTIDQIDGKCTMTIEGKNVAGQNTKKVCYSASFRFDNCDPVQFN